MAGLDQPAERMLDKLHHELDYGELVKGLCEG